MTDDSDIPKNNPSEQPSDAGFLGEFQKLIKSYAEATEAGRTEEATQAALSAFMMAAREAERNPTPDLKLAERAQECESTGDWAGAEAAYRERLALSESSGKPGLRAKWQMDLSRLLALVGRWDEAWELAQAATASARASDISPLIAMALDFQASQALDRGDPTQARQAAQEAVGVLEPGPLTVHMRARFLIRRAECLLAGGDLAAAETDLTASRELLDQITLGLPGHVLAQARWWEVRAKLERQVGQVSQAEDLLNKATEFRRLRAEDENAGGSARPYSIAALVKDYEALCELAHDRGDSAAALAALSEAKRLRERAHLPDAPRAV